MSKFLLVILVAPVFLILILWFLGKDMRTVTTEIEIAAEPSEVWSKLAQIDKWKDWSPIIKDSEGNASLGSKLVITMISEEGKDGKPGPRYEPVITQFDVNKNLTWTANMMAGFIMTNGKVLELVETGSGTKLIHKETFQGAMVPLMWSSVEKNVPGMLDSMNLALKSLVEGN